MTDTPAQPPMLSEAMKRNCLTCGHRGPARTPSCSKKPEWAATCEYPLPTLGMISSNVTDVRRHLNLATIIEDSPHYNPDHAAKACETWTATHD